MACGEVGDIDDDDRLWRRVQDSLDHMFWDDTEGCWRVRPRHPSNSLQFNPDLSAWWSRHLLVDHGQGPEAALDAAGRYTLVFELVASEARRLGCTVRHSPWGNILPDCAHASVEWPTPTNRAVKAEIRDGLSRAMALVHGTPTVVPPPGA